jgi:glycosyltransferase involved in cell wall biosynthesis
MTSPLKVLVLDGVGPFGGASRSFFEVARQIPKDKAVLRFVVQQGTANPFYRQVSDEMLVVSGLTRLDHTRVSHYRGKRWLIALRELRYLPTTILSLLRARKRWPDIDLIHVNEVTEIIPGLIARRLFQVPLIVHVRSLQHMDKTLWRTRWLHDRLVQDAAAVIAIDEGVRATLPVSAPVTVIHNAFTPTPAKSADAAYLQQLDRLRPGAMKVGFVGNLHRAKGLKELIEAMARVKAAGADVQLLVVGGGTRAEGGIARSLARMIGLLQDVDDDLDGLLASHGLSEDVLILGHTDDIQRVYQRMDVIAFPSYFDAPGRPVFEAGFSAVPSIVAVRQPRADTLVHMETGIAIAEPTPALIAEAILHFARDRAEIARMGANARALAERNFDPRKNVQKLLALYAKATERPVSSQSVEPLGGVLPPVIAE